MLYFLFHNSISRILLKINFTSLPFSLIFFHFFSPLLQFFLIRVVNSLTDSLDDFYTVQAGIGTDIDLLSLSFTSNSVSPRSSGPVSTSHVRSVSIIQCMTVQYSEVLFFPSSFPTFILVCCIVIFLPIFIYCLLLYLLYLYFPGIRSSSRAIPSNSKSTQTRTKS